MIVGSALHAMLPLPLLEYSRTRRSFSCIANPPRCLP